MTATLPNAATPRLDAEHPAQRIEYRDSDHSYRLRNTCVSCIGVGRVPGAREGTTKQCGKCNGEGVRFERVPSVTTILAELNKPALVGWAAKMGAEAARARLVQEASDLGAYEHTMTVDLMLAIADEVHELALNAHRDVKDESADIGTAVHDWIEQYVSLREGVPLPEDPDVRPACEAFIDWWLEAGYTIEATERIVVDTRARYAGRFDLIVRDRRGLLYVLDIKTSNSIYLEHVLQCAAYATALRQETGESVAGTLVVWCHKDGRPVRTVARTPRQYRSDFRVFAALLGVYEHRKLLGGELRKLAKESAIAADPTTVPFL